MINETFWELRTYALILKSVLESEEKDRDLELAQSAIKEIVNILAEISHVYGLWGLSGKPEQVPHVKE